MTQGRFLGRPSFLFVTVRDSGNEKLDVFVAGDVRLIARGTLGGYGRLLRVLWGEVSWILRVPNNPYDTGYGPWVTTSS